MFQWPLRRERAPRTKNGQPAQRTTGVARRNCVHWLQADDAVCASAGTRCAMPRRKTGTVSAAPVQKRRVMLRSS